MLILGYEFVGKFCILVKYLLLVGAPYQYLSIPINTYLYISINIREIMKNHIIIPVLILFSFPAFTQTEQSNCKVLLNTINEIYRGECKKGLAHGKGFAEGIDTYDGTFKKGFPHGKGLYTWNSGDYYEGSWKNGMRDGKGAMTVKMQDRDSIMAGYWVENTYIGKVARPITYKVLEKDGIDRLTFFKVDDHGGTIEIFFTMLGNNLIPENLFFYMDKGNVSSIFTGYSDIDFPVKCYMTYQRTNQLGEGTIDCRLTFEIHDPGRWEVYVYH